MPDKDPARYFSKVIQKRESGGLTYSAVAPAAVVEIILLVSGRALNYAKKAPKNFFGFPEDFAGVISALLCAFAIMLTGIFAVIEYLMAFLEFMLVTSVGIILFPLSLWDGTKFMAEKLIAAITGFFIKLLFCNICIFLMLYGYISLLANTAFNGEIDQIFIVIFVSLLFFFICKSAPGLAQSLLTGTPSLSAAGAIGAATSAIAAGAGALNMVKKAGGAVAGQAAKTAFAGTGALSQAGGAADAVKELGGSGKEQAGAFMRSLGSSAKESMLTGGGNLARSLISGGQSGGGGAGGGWLNRHDQLQHHLGRKNAAGDNETLGEYAAGRYAAGENRGQDYMLQKEQKRNQKAAAANNKE